MAVEGDASWLTKYLLGLVKLAQERDIHFNPGYYRWKLGAYHYYNLKNDYEATYGKIQPEEDCIPMIFEIPVEVEYSNILAIELWQNITNDL